MLIAIIIEAQVYMYIGIYIYINSKVINIQ